MKNKAFKVKRLRLATLMLAGAVSAPVAAQTVDLMAVPGVWTSPAGPVTMWGFAADTGSCPTSPVVWGNGPQISATPGDTLTINLRNCLAEPVSMIIPGQNTTFSPVFRTDAKGRQRVTSFTTPAPADNGATQTAYNWANLKAGTYLYQSGTRPALQVPMGLYGALTVGSYAGAANDVTLLYSEVDPVLHASGTSANPLNYKPQYYLVNGELAQNALSGGDTDSPTVLRLLNAGLDYHVPELSSGNLSVVAEDGNPYPYARKSHLVFLPAGKTKDALWQPSSSGVYTLSDRRLHGMQARFTVGAGGNGPVADSYPVDEDVLLTVPAPGVLTNDPAGSVVTLMNNVSSGTLTLMADGSFTYQPNANFTGTDSFTYTTDASIVPATVTITVNPVNDAPVAVDDAFDVVDGTTTNIPVAGVLANDTDIDGDTLTATVLSGPTNGTLVLNADGSFDYTHTATGTVSDSFTYTVIDGNGGTDTGTVNLTVVAANNPPTAVADAANTTEGVPVTINVLANDGDIDLDPLSVVSTTTPTSGSVVINVDNSITYTPNANFNGSDSFDYTIEDGRGGSDTATVSITVAAVNVAPVAVEDYFAGVPRNTTNYFLNLVANDTDVDGNLTNGGGNVPAANITLTTGATTSRRGTLTVVDNGVQYTPRTNFRGTDTFSYTVTDQAGAISNEVKVRINVVR